MPEAKTLAVGVAILTILGMTIALAVPMGPSFTGDDDPDNSGVTSAQGDQMNNTTDNSPTDNSTDTDNDGDDDDPEDSGDNNSSDSPPCESNGDSSDSSGESDCGSGDDGTDDQDGEKNKDEDGDGDGDGSDSEDSDDGTNDQDGEKDKDGDGDGDGSDSEDSDDGTNDQDGEKDKDGDGDGGDGNETDENGEELGTCEQDGLLLNNTLANELFGTENESGPISEVIHENEGYFMQGGVVFHESGCIVATLDNNVPGGDGGDGDGENGENGNETDENGNETDDGTDGENGTNGDSELGTCETGGAIQEATLANTLFGTENEEGPISSNIHINEDMFMQGNMIVHEVGCIVATLDNNASGDGGNIPEAP